MTDDLSEFFQELAKEKKQKKEEFNELVGDLNLDSIFSEVSSLKKESKKKKVEEKKAIKAFEEFLFSEEESVEKEEKAEEAIREWIEDPVEEIVEEPEVESEPEEDLIEKSLGLLAEPEPEQQFATLDDLSNHYKIFIDRIQQQLSTLGGGGEVRLEFLDDVDRDSAKVNGRFLRYNSSTGKWIGANVSGGGGGDSEYASSAGIATEAVSAGIATFATSSGIATEAVSAGIATFATSSGVSTYATSSGIATEAVSAGIATYATSSGVSTYATSSGIATEAVSAGIATYASTSGVSTYATSSGIATESVRAGLATEAISAGIATFATTAGIASNAYWVQTISGIHTTSNVGIGTTVPDTPLHIRANDAQLVTVERIGDLNAGIRFRNEDGSMFAGLAENASGFAIDDDDNLGSGPMFLVERSSGRVGIGTDSPTQELEIFNSSFSGIKIRSSRTALTEQIGGVGFSTSSDQVATINALVDGTVLVKNTTSNTERARITSSGNVGIGSQDPNRKLVVEDSGNTFISVKAGTSDDVGIIFGDTSADSRGQVRYVNSDDSLELWAGGSERTKLTSSGRLGISSSIPEGYFSVGVSDSDGVVATFGNYGGGRLGVTQNDGGGNLNLTFNHANEKADQDGSSGRIHCNVDGTSAQFEFELHDNVTQGTTYDGSAMTQVLQLRTDDVRFLNATHELNSVGLGIHCDPGNALDIQSGAPNIRLFNTTGAIVGNDNSGWIINVVAGNAVDNANGLNLNYDGSTKVEFDTTGNITVPGINLGNETLDEYDEGTFTPTYNTSNSDIGTVNHDIQSGRYVRIGKICYFSLRVRTDSISAVGSGTVEIRGLPFTCVNATNNRAAMTVYSANWTAGDAPTLGLFVHNNAKIRLYQKDYNEDASVLAPSRLNTGTNDNDVRISGVYEVQG